MKRVLKLFGIMLLLLVVMTGFAAAATNGPSITTQPVSKTVAAGTTATFTVAATGTGTLTYQWQSRVDSSSSWANSGQSGNKTATLSVAATNGLHGYQFRCVVTDGNGQKAYSNVVTLAVSPRITSQPVSTSVTPGSTAKFTVTVASAGTPSYQWQFRKNENSAWADSAQSGNKTATLSVAATAALHGYQFRCVVTEGGNRKVYTSAATLYILPKISTQPASKTVAPGANATFTVAATGAGTLTYRWQYRKNSTASWAYSAQSGNKTATLSVKATNALHGYQFRCVVKQVDGKTVYSNAVTLSVSPRITTQPVSLNAAKGTTAKFSVTAVGTETLTYQWQYRKDANSAWAASAQSGNKTAELSVSASAGLNEYQFRCVITDGGNRTVYTDAVTLYIIPNITTQPVSKTVLPGSTATFTIAATGVGTLTYQWQFRKNSTAAWANSGQTGNKTTTLSVNTTNALNGYQFRCVVTHGNGLKAYSNVVTLTVSPRITSHPANKSVTAGSTANFSVTAAGAGTLTYQWQYRKDASSSWAASAQSGNKTATLSVAATAGLNGYQFRCVIKDGGGRTVYTNPATLYIIPKITTQPVSKTVTPGSTATFTVAATGKGTLTYQWQYRKDADSAWAASGQTGNKTATLSVKATNGLHGYQFRCVITDSNGQKAYSNTVTLTVSPRITAQPVSTTAAPGSKAIFTVTAAGTGSLTYQWQYRKNASSAWAASGQSGNKTATLSVAATAGLNGYQFRCIIKDSQGRSVTSAVATLTITSLINATDVTLYVIEDAYKDVLTLPAGKSDSFQLVANGTNVSFYQPYDWYRCCDVDSNGLITVHYYDIYNLSTGEMESDPRYGDSVITCEIDGKTVTVNVHVVDYAVVYADEKIEEYLKANITSGMSDMEKMEAIAAYPASFNYDYHYYSYVPMIIHGGGDCWASTSLIIRECEMLGIDAWVRNGNKDPGAGSGHRNAMAYYNGVYYMLEAGYTGNAPRMYNVTICSSLYSIRYVSDEAVSIYQYDGKIEDLGDKWVLPDMIGGKKVTAIEDSFSYSFAGTEIVLPKYLERIGNYAFTGCSNLTKLKIPANVSYIGNGAFAQDTKLTLTIDPANPYLTVKDNCVYSKDLTVMYEAPSASGKITLPSTLTEIRPYVFYYNSNVTEIVVPASVTTIGEGAFGNCAALTKVTFAGNKITNLDSFIFPSTGNLSEVTIPSSVTEIDTYAFIYAGPINVIMKSKQAPTWTGVDITLSDYYSTVVFYVPEGSTGYDTGKWADVTVIVGTPES